MSRVDRGKVCISDRDRLILKLIFESKVCFKKQIAEQTFPQRHITTCERRLRKLSKAGLIQPSALFIKRKCFTLYSITSKGLLEISSYSNYTIDKPCLNSDSKEHDLELVDIIFKLRAFNNVKQVITENALQCYEELREDDELYKFASIRSDGAIKIKVKNNLLLVALEYDRTKKGERRYLQKIRDYYTEDKIKGIFYICENQSMMDHLMKFDKKSCRSEVPKFFFCLKDDLLKAEREITFTNCEGQIIRIN